MTVMQEVYFPKEVIRDAESLFARSAERVTRSVEAGRSCHAAAAHFSVSVSFVVKLMRAFRATGSLKPNPSGGRRNAKLDPHRAFLLARIAEKPDITMPELSAELLAATGTQADAASLSRWLIRNGYRFKKTLLASEQDRPAIKAAREEWTATRQPRMRLEPHRLIFLDETGTTTKMTRLRGRCLSGERLRSKAPFGHWMTQTFVAGLRCDKLTAPFVVDAPMDRRIFETYVEKELAPTLDKGDVVIMDNLAAHKSPRAEKAIKARAHGSCSCRLIVPISIRSKWPSQSLKPISAQRPLEPSMPSGRRSGTSAISSSLQNA
jgi:transposase